MPKRLNSPPLVGPPPVMLERGAVPVDRSNEGRRQGRGEGPDALERIRRPIACVRENRVAAWLHEGPFAGRFDDSSVYLPGWW